MSQNNLTSAPLTVPNAVFLLNAATSSQSERLSALRTLAQYAANPRNKLSNADRQNFNRLIYDNIMFLILGEDKSVDLRRRQLIRTECFLMLSKILQSNTLFGDSEKRIKAMREDIVEHEAQMRAAEELDRSLKEREKQEKKEEESRQRLVLKRAQTADAELGYDLGWDQDENSVEESPLLSPFRRATHKEDANQPAESPSSHFIDIPAVRESVSANGSPTKRSPTKKSQQQRLNQLESNSPTKKSGNNIVSSPQKRGRGAVSPQKRSTTSGNFSEDRSSSPSATTPSNNIPSSPFGDKPRPTMAPPGGWVVKDGPGSAQKAGKASQLPLSVRTGSNQENVNPQSPSKRNRRLGASLSVSALGTSSSSSSSSSSPTSQSQSKDKRGVDEHEGSVSGNSVHTLMSSSSQPAISTLKTKDNKIHAETAAKSGKGPDLSVLKPTLIRRPKKLVASENRKLGPRPSVFFQDKYAPDDFYSGQDSSDWFEQDRRLGYQKSRMWVPVPQIALDAPLVPEKRFLEKTNSDRIVDEYLQVRSLMSYVGDLVMTYERPHDGKVVATGGISKRMEGVLDKNRYKKAVEEAISVWTPLLGAHLPAWVTKRKGMSAFDKREMIRLKQQDHQLEGLKEEEEEEEGEGEEKENDLYGDTEGPEEYSRRNSAMTTSHSVTSSLAYSQGFGENAPEADSFEKVVLVTKGVLRHLLKKEILQNKQFGVTLRDTLDVVIHTDNVNEIDGNVVSQKQNELQGLLTDQAQTLKDEANTLHKLMRETIKAQYASLPPRYLLLLQGSKANQRKVLSRFVDIYIKYKRHNSLSLAFGTWKISLVRHEIESRRAFYSKYAAVYLMNGWVLYLKYKKMRKWVERWRKEVRARILYERHQAVIPIQTMARRVRDKMKCLQMHKAGPYHGPLSDIYLAEDRPDLKFKIPVSIRNHRRAVWMAVIPFQTLYRKFKLYTAYKDKRKKVALINKYCRMWPKYVQYQYRRAIFIFMQSCLRRTVKRNRFKFLKKTAIFIQKYLRRFLEQCRLRHRFEKVWRKKEAVMWGPIPMQYAMRRALARRRVRRIKVKRIKREWAACTVQAQFYRRRDAFATFALMRAYQAREILDALTEKLAKRKKYRKNAQKIRRFYSRRFQRIFLPAVIKIQGWIRGRITVGVLKAMRLEKWAARKLHHWARGMIRRRHAIVRRIQNWWWNHKPGTRLKHLQITCALRDQRRRQRLADIRYFAASRIEAFVKGTFARRWFKRETAAMKLQRNFRPIIQRRIMVRKLKNRMKNGVSRFVTLTLQKGTKNALLYILKKHSENMRKPQALVRGVLVRARLARAKAFALKYGIAVVTVQRFWRKTGAFGQAVDEVLAMRRMVKSPFRYNVKPHDVLLSLRQLSLDLYDGFDIRCGMKLSTFLYRLAKPDLYKVFSRLGKSKKYPQTVRDLIKYSLSKLNRFYYDMVDQLEREVANKNAESAIKGSKSAMQEAAVAAALSSPTRKSDAPKEAFRELLRFAKLPAFDPRAIAECEMIRPVQELMTPSELGNYVIKLFTKKFGNRNNHLCLRVATTIVDSAFQNLNSHKIVTNVVTKAMIKAAISTSSDPKSILTNLEKLKKYPSVAYSDDRAWDLERYKKAEDLLQLAVERILSHFDRGDMGCVAKWVRSEAEHVSAYRRKFKYISRRAVNKSSHSGQSHGVHNATNANHGSGHHEGVGVAQHVDSSLQIKENEPLVFMSSNYPPANQQVVLSSWDWSNLSLDYNHGISDDKAAAAAMVEQLEELERCATVCRIYAQLLHKLTKISCAVSKLAIKWRSNSVARAVAKKMNEEFIKKTTEEYFKDRHLNHPKRVWETYKDNEKKRRILEKFIQDMHDKRSWLENKVSQIPVYGWVQFKDDATGEPYWMHRFKLTTVHERPHYSLEEHLAVLKIQRRVYKLLARVREDRKKREELKQLQLLKLQAEHLEMSKISVRQVKFSLSLSTRDVLSLAVNGFNTASNENEENSEMHMPYNLRVSPAKNVQSGLWALYATTSKISTTQSYEPAFVFNVKQSSGVCDVKTLKNEVHRKVPLNNIFHMHYCKGDLVEVLAPQSKYFFEAIITHVKEFSPDIVHYSVELLDDGKELHSVTRFRIRPSKTLFQSFLTGRSLEASKAAQRNRRLLHFQNLKKERMDRLVNSCIRPSISQFTHAWGMTQDSTYNSILDRMIEEEIASIDRRNAKLKKKAPVESEKAKFKRAQAAVRARLPPVGAYLKGLLSTSTALQSYAILPKISLKYIRKPVRFGFFVRHNGTSLEYYDPILRKVYTDPPIYEVVQMYSIVKIQSVIRGYMTRKRVKAMCVGTDLETLIKESITKYQKLASINYGLEGVTNMQILRRAGYADIAQDMENFYRSNIVPVTLQKLASLKQDDFQDIGVMEYAHVRTLLEFQSWYKRTPRATREAQMQFINHFSSSTDPRTIRKCIKDSDAIILQAFLKAYPTNPHKTIAAIRTMIDESMFPITQAQLNTFLKKYKDKPDLARENLKDLINIPTTHTFMEEREALKVIRKVTTRITSVLMILRVRQIHRRLRRAEMTVAGMLKKAQSEGHDRERDLCPSWEGKAALHLRIEGLDYTLRCLRAILILQRRIRGFTKRKMFKSRTKIRNDAATRIQLAARSMIARKSAILYRQQQKAEWEQLWDNRRNMMYYYNKITKESKYGEPRTIFRPLVRDRRSARLVQAWPHLDLLNKPQKKDSSVCFVCEVRKTVRVCHDCPTAISTSDLTMPTSYCYPCFNKVHSEEGAETDHRFTKYEPVVASLTSKNDLTYPSPTPLMCCVCDDTPATRKCRGLLTDEQIDSLCSELQFTHPREWNAKLKEAGVAGERKLRIMLESIASSKELIKESKKSQGSEGSSSSNPSSSSSSDGNNASGSPTSSSASKAASGFLKAFANVAETALANKDAIIASNAQANVITVLSAAEVLEVRALLERTRAECDECYCKSCYENIHSGGKRALHKWIGFAPYAPVCGVCACAPTESICTDCEEGTYCSSCFKVFHGKGKKRRHRARPYIESTVPTSNRSESELALPVDLCMLCNRRPMQEECPKCANVYCDSCFECTHVHTHRNRGGGGAGAGAGAAGGSRNLRQTTSSSVNAGTFRGPGGGGGGGMDGGGDEASLDGGSSIVASSTQEDNDGGDGFPANTDRLGACVVCGKMADRKCDQCGDLYCSKRWMGNPGCFEGLHEKGNRSRHTYSHYHIDEEAFYGSSGNGGNGGNGGNASHDKGGRGGNRISSYVGSFGLVL